MAKYSNKKNVSEQTKNEAMKIARGTQRPGQTKEQTKLIAQGIQKGIDLYKKQQKSKARELDKKLKKVSQEVQPGEHQDESQTDPVHANRNQKLPWALLLLSWLGFALYLGLT